MCESGKKASASTRVTAATVHPCSAWLHTAGAAGAQQGNRGASIPHTHQQPQQVNPKFSQTGNNKKDHCNHCKAADQPLSLLAPRKAWCGCRSIADSMSTLAGCYTSVEPPHRLSCIGAGTCCSTKQAALKEANSPNKKGAPRAPTLDQRTRTTHKIRVGWRAGCC